LSDKSISSLQRNAPAKQGGAGRRAERLFAARKRFAFRDRHRCATPRGEFSGIKISYHAHNMNDSSSVAYIGVIYPIFCGHNFGIFPTGNDAAYSFN
jgi:hypothetical protein